MELQFQKNGWTYTNDTLVSWHKRVTGLDGNFYYIEVSESNVGITVSSLLDKQYSYHTKLFSENAEQLTFFNGCAQFRSLSDKSFENPINYFDQETVQQMNEIFEYVSNKRKAWLLKMEGGC